MLFRSPQNPKTPKPQNPFILKMKVLLLTSLFSICLSTCVTVNGIVTGVEECDDNNPTASDGCYNCRIEAGWTCAGAPSVCAVNSVCGNGVVDGGE